MFIKLMPDQVTVFWDAIKEGMIKSYKVPKDYQQDFAIKALERFLSNLAQCWVGFHVDNSNNRILDFIITSKIVNIDHCGIRALFIDSLYGLNLLTDDVAVDAYKNLGKFALANNCCMISTETSNNTIEEFLLTQGFEKGNTSYKKDLHN